MWCDSFGRMLGHRTVKGHLKSKLCPAGVWDCNGGPHKAYPASSIMNLSKEADALFKKDMSISLGEKGQLLVSSVDTGLRCSSIIGRFIQRLLTTHTTLMLMAPCRVLAPNCSQTHCEVCVDSVSVFTVPASPS